MLPFLDHMGFLSGHHVSSTVRVHQILLDPLSQVPIPFVLPSVFAVPIHEIPFGSSGYLRAHPLVCASMYRKHLHVLWCPRPNGFLKCATLPGASLLLSYRVQP